jgi:arsenate reductase (thioredoxin)
MAEGWINHLYPGEMKGHSAGLISHGLNPLAVTVMKEAGVDISSHTSKHLDIVQGISFDIVITVCDDAHESCPVFNNAKNPNPKMIHCGFDDPPTLTKGFPREEALPHYRRVRDEIRDFIQALPQIINN